MTTYARNVLSKKTRPRLKRRRGKRTRERPTIRFTPYSWSKLLYFRDVGETEIGAFGLSSADDLLRVEDIHLIKQTCTAVTTELHDEAIADFFDEQVDAGRTPEQFGRIWIHTHPGDCPNPSPTDEATFERCFGHAHWAVMFIIARGGRTYCRLQFNVGPRSSQTLKVDIDYSEPFAGTAEETWFEEYEASVTAEDWHHRHVAEQHSNLMDLYDSIDEDLRPYLDGDFPWPESYWPDTQDPIRQESLCPSHVLD